MASEAVGGRVAGCRATSGRESGYGAPRPRITYSARGWKEVVGLTRLGEVLSAADRLPLDADLFLPFDEVWGPDTRCAVASVDRYADEPVLPDLAARNGLGRALQVAQVQDIVDNARQQLPRAKSEDLVEAFLFYYDRDAFIDFSRRAETGTAPDCGGKT
jgi:hypothetical protein